MSNIPALPDLELALAAAGSAHHDFETRYLTGVHDALWPGFYAAYVLGRLGNFAQPSDLARWLAEVKAESAWPAAAAKHVLERLGQPT